MKLKINNLCFNYTTIPILRNINLDVELGEMLSIVGPNGSGKSTLLKCINRILKPKRDTVLVDGKDTGKLNLKELSLMGYVLRVHKLFPFKAFDVVMMGRKPYIHWSIGERDNEIVAQMRLLVSGTLQCVTSMNPAEVSNKVIIARALAQQPKLMLR